MKCELYETVLLVGIIGWWISSGEVAGNGPLAGGTLLRLDGVLAAPWKFVMS